MMKKLLIIGACLFSSITVQAAPFNFTSTTESGFYESDYLQIETFLTGHDTDDLTKLMTFKESLDTEIKLKTEYNLSDGDISLLASLYETGVSKGIWSASDITDTELRQKYVEWQTKLQRLEELGE